MTTPIYSIAEKAPVFPCWILSTLFNGMWWHCPNEESFSVCKGDDDIYWSPHAENAPPRPDSSTAPQVGPEEFSKGGDEHGPVVSDTSRSEMPAIQSDPASRADLRTALSDLVTFVRQLPQLDYVHVSSQERICFSPDGPLARAENVLIGKAVEAPPLPAEVREALSIARTAIERSLDGVSKFDGYFRHHRKAIELMDRLNVTPIKEEYNGL